MVPIIELRGAIPTGILGMGLNPVLVFIVSVIGNMLPVPIILLFVRRVFEWMKRKSKRLGDIARKFEAKAESKKDKVLKYEVLGLMLFVAIPAPGTGAWTGALIAAMLDMRLKKAVPTIALGVLTAGIIMSVVSVFFAELVVGLVK
ncbi:MAG: small multidrug export protein [Ruminococcaceae bacterium]|nr:small multidrug export protein [Oscillospiraceae bacterium]